MSYTDREVTEQIFLSRNWYAPDGRTWRNDAPVPANAGYKLSQLPSTAKVGSRDSARVWELRGETDPSLRALRASQPQPAATPATGPTQEEIRKMISDAVEAAEQDKDEEIADLEKTIADLRAEKQKLEAAAKAAEKK